MRDYICQEHWSVIWPLEHLQVQDTSSPASTPASTTTAWAHLRVLRDTGNTCHGSPDLGEGPIELTHVPHVHGMPREGDRTTGVDACVGTAEGVSHSVESKHTIRVTHREHAEL